MSSYGRNAPKPKNRFERAQNKNEQHDRILIVCEDSKKSIEYFKALCRDLRLSNSVEIRGEDCGSDPHSVLKHAKDLIDEDITRYGENDTFDRAYCVFDKDNHKNYKQTIQQIKNEKLHKSVELHYTYCNPCFEFWILLHFKNTAKPLPKCADVKKEIKEIFKGFNKKETNYGTLYTEQLKQKMPEAIQHSKQIAREADNTGATNSYTNIHELIEYLIKDSKK